jgi:hypothetical protein
MSFTVPPSPAAAEKPPPKASSWIAGDVTVVERDGPHVYSRAILIAFATVEEMRAAMRLVEPMLQIGERR